MGLDTVELVMAIEDEFQIAIPNEVAAKLIRVGDLYAFVLDALRQRGDVADLSRIWGRLKGVFVDQCGIPEEQFVAEASIVDDFGLD